MAGLALFLASPAAAHITAAHIITDGQDISLTLLPTELTYELL
jgi:hypothetical protein